MNSTEAEYRSFPDKQRRNWGQEHFELPLMIRVLGLRRGARILEVGCGRGVALPVLERLLSPARLVGVDIDPALASIARERLQLDHSRIEVVVGDLRALPFADESFDTVLDFGTCYHIARSGDALREIARVLGPGGVFATETRISQLLSHPWRSRGRSLKWRAAPSLTPLRRAILWDSRLRTGD